VLPRRLVVKLAATGDGVWVASLVLQLVCTLFMRYQWQIKPLHHLWFNAAMRDGVWTSFLSFVHARVFLIANKAPPPPPLSLLTYHISFMGIRTLSHSATRSYGDAPPLTTTGLKEEVTCEVMCWM
jgi:hypothetical protein